MVADVENETAGSPASPVLARWGGKDEQQAYRQTRFFFDFSLRLVACRWVCGLGGRGVIKLARDNPP